AITELLGNRSATCDQALNRLFVNKWTFAGLHKANLAAERALQAEKRRAGRTLSLSRRLEPLPPAGSGFIKGGDAWRKPHQRRKSKE
ncbi:hypothetical protein LJC15_04885, partial [Desulfovibrio sp. OttesenSCG-928-G11]|nr:hypothetical protein [Desulfovibrio sp. OttesenSCG-928-G11]